MGLKPDAMPPGTLIPNSKQTVNPCKINFPSDELYNDALPPINRVSYSKDGTAIYVSSFFLVDSALLDGQLDDLQFSVYQLYCISDAGYPILQCYITSNYTNGKTNIYGSVQVEFAITNDLLEGTGLTVTDVTGVQTFLWNVDPRTSRGTVTTVLPATG